MRTIALVAFAATVTAAAAVYGLSTTDTVVEVEQTASGLQMSDGIANPNLPERTPTVLKPGAYLATVVEVVRSHEDRTDLYDGAEFPYEVRPSDESDGYILNRRLEIGGLDGRLRGEGRKERADPVYNCTATVELAVRGRAPESFQFGLVVEENVFVHGEECDLSDLGPARAEENVYRLRVVADE